MSLPRLPDWKKIGKGIRDGLRDILNPPDPGPSDEERLAQRHRDSLKGLVYFDNFDEVFSWQRNDVDPVQQANMPLLDRPSHGTYDQEGPKSQILLCHDYSGGYHEWEGVRPPVLVDTEYTCQYWQCVEIFVYFSHKLVCIPPAAWINTCHRNGVKVLGTFLLEGSAPNIDRMLEHADGEYVVARRLADMAQHYNFDGWLLNIEASFPKSVQQPIRCLTAFIRNLKRLLGPQKVVIWYDAITKDNDVDYQNALTSKNVDFALAADAIFTNYKWTHHELNETTAIAAQYDIRRAEIYFGIDVWAQNNNMPGPPRVTFPPKGGGGTLTGLAVRHLAEHGFSAAIFAPGWPFEHFAKSTPNNGISIAEAVDESMWEGTKLPDELGCDCKKDEPHHRAGYQSNPIVKAAEVAAAGTSVYFETDFRQAFHRLPDAKDQASQTQYPIQPAIGYQSILPCLSYRRHDSASRTILRGELQEDPRSCFTVSAVPPRCLISPPCYSTKSVLEEHTYSIFKLNLDASVPLVGYVAFKAFPLVAVTCTGFYLRFESFDSPRIANAASDLKKYPISHNGYSEEQTMNLDLGESVKDLRIVDFGVFCKSLSDDLADLRVLSIYTVVFRPSPSELFVRTRNLSAPWTIEGVRIGDRRAGTNMESRLLWNWNGLKDGWPQGLPWSRTTGPFSSFSVTIADRTAGHAQCLEFPLHADDFDTEQFASSCSAVVLVTGYLFGGGEIASAPVELSLTHNFGRCRDA